MSLRFSRFSFSIGAQHHCLDAEGEIRNSSKSGVAEWGGEICAVLREVRMEKAYRPQRRGQEWKGDVLLVVLCRDSALLRSSDVELAVWRVQRAYK